MTRRHDICDGVEGSHSPGMSRASLRYWRRRLFRGFNAGIDDNADNSGRVAAFRRAQISLSTLAAYDFLISVLLFFMLASYSVLSPRRRRKASLSTGDIALGPPPPIVMPRQADSRRYRRHHFLCAHRYWRAASTRHALSSGRRLACSASIGRHDNTHVARLKIPRR